MRTCLDLRKRLPHLAALLCLIAGLGIAAETGLANTAPVAATNPVEEALADAEAVEATTPAAPADAAAIAATDDLKIGDPAARVREVLGESRGSIRSGDRALLLYDRGRVEITDGVVTRIDLVSEEEAAIRKEEAARAAASRRQREAEARTQRLAAGTAELERTLTNPEFAASSGVRQVEYWSSFRRRYPEVNVDAEYAAALARRDAELAAGETARRLADMEQRVAEAEERARDAQDAAEDARRDNRYRGVYYYPPFVNYTYPVVVAPAPRPPCTTVRPVDSRITHRTYLGVAPIAPPTSSYTVYPTLPYVGTTYVAPCPAPPPPAYPGMRVSVNF